MANPQRVTLQLVAAVANGYALAQQPAAAGPLTLNGSLVSGGVGTADVARRVAAVSTSAGDTTQTVTVQGGDRNGNAISEVLTLNGTTAVYTQQDFLTVTGAVISAGTAGNVTLGTNGIASTAWFVQNIMFGPFSLAIAVYVNSAQVNPVNYTVEHTYDDPNASMAGSIEPTSAQPPLAWQDSILVGKSTSGESNATMPSFATRLTINSGTGAATMYLLQAGVHN